MGIWTDATINRFVAEGEDTIAKTVKCNVGRIALEIVENTDKYVLPTDLLFIRSVSYRGMHLDPLPMKNWRDRDNITSKSKPDWYVFNQQGQNTIRFVPIPSESITADQTEVWGAGIGTQAIVEYYQLPGDVVKLPIYIRRRLLKYYVLKSCFAIEGKGQNFKAVKKYQQRYDFYIKVFQKVYSGVFVAKENVIGTGSHASVIAPPHLPYDKFGISVDE